MDNKNISDDSDILSAKGVYSFLKGKHEVVVLDKTDSTNEEVKRRALQGADEGLVLISDFQSAGKGRRGRGFFSPKGSGLYISILYKPGKTEAGDIVLVTTQAAVAVSLAIEEVYKKTTAIKWVNDVYIGEKKVCGILTEAVSDYESSGIDIVVVGIGINIKKPKSGVPDEIKDVAGFILTDDEKISYPHKRNALAASIVNHLDTFYHALPDRPYISEYRSRSNVIGHTVCYGENLENEGMAVGIDDMGGLIIRLSGGREEILHTGEISLRVVKDEPTDMPPP